MYLEQKLQAILQRLLKMFDLKWEKNNKIKKKPKTNQNPKKSNPNHLKSNHEMLWKIEFVFQKGLLREFFFCTAQFFNSIL